MVQLYSLVEIRQPVGYIQAWPRIWTRDDPEQIQQLAKTILKPGPGSPDREYDALDTRLRYLPKLCSSSQVWITRSNTGKKLEDIPIPFNDVKNILDEIHFEDEFTRSRCRGWLVLPSRKYLQADILFPGCEFDCRLTIRGRMGMTWIETFKKGGKNNRNNQKHMRLLVESLFDGFSGILTWWF